MANGHTRLTPADRKLHGARVQQLNVAVGVTTRRLFQSHAQLDNKQQLPAELTAFLDALALYESSAAVRSVFRDPEAQWLSRSAVQSGAAAVLCDQLLRRAENEYDGSEEARLDLALVLVLMCDQLFASCAASSSRECVWRGRKPAYHAMPCFSTWDTLLPFIERVAKRSPSVVREALGLQTLEWQQQLNRGRMVRHSYAQRRADGDDNGSDAPTVRVNCKFAQVVGLWRLVETLGSSSVGADEGSEADQLALLDASLQFLMRTKVLEGVVADDTSSFCTEVVRRGDGVIASNDAALYDDLLMDKFFSRLQEFLFDCPRSKHVAKHALQSAIIDCVRDCVTQSHRRTVHTVDTEAVQDGSSAYIARPGAPAGLSVFAATTCVFVKDLARSIVSSVRNIITSYQTGDTTRDVSDTTCRELLLFLVGFCAHVDLVPLSTVLEVFSDLLTLYGTAEEGSASQLESTVESAEIDKPRAEIVLWILYVAVYRTDAVRDLQRRYEHSTGCRSSEDARASEVREQYLQLLDFQDRLTGEVDSYDFYAMPLEWMTVFWREWFSFSDEEILSFLQSYDDHHGHHRQQQQLLDFQHRRVPQDLQELDTTDTRNSALGMLKILEDALPIRTADCVFAKQMKLLGSHFIRADFIDRILQQQEQLQRDSPQHSVLLDLSVRTRRKRRRFVAPVDPAAEERKLNVLMLPEVMERVCSFMSAKRLCRLATVCQGFAEVSRSDRLWRQLFSSLTSREVEPILCRHGTSYTHDWRGMYRERWEARKRLRKKQRAVTTKMERSLLANEDAEGAGPATELSAGSAGGAAALFAVQLCRICGCNRLLTTASQLETHMKTHELLTCSQIDCDAAFSTLSQLKKHRKECHTEKAVDASKPRAPKDSSVKPRMECGFGGCTMSYASLKRLTTHRKLKNHQYTS